MTGVPTTETSIDRNLEKKRLETEITILKGIHERATNDTKTTVKAADEAFGRLESLKNEAVELGSVIAGVSRETLEYIRFCEALIRETSEKTIKIMDWTKELDAIVIKGSENLEKTKIEAKRIHEMTVKENEDLSRKKNDLDVYHRRLKEHFEKHLPGHVITI